MNETEQKYNFHKCHQNIYIYIIHESESYSKEIIDAVGDFFFVNCVISLCFFWVEEFFAHVSQTRTTTIKHQI